MTAPKLAERRTGPGPSSPWLMLGMASKAVNNVKNNGPELLEPLPATEV